MLNYTKYCSLFLSFAKKTFLFLFCINFVLRLPPAAVRRSGRRRRTSKLTKMEIMDIAFHPFTPAPAPQKLPVRLNCPFCYRPHPLAVRAAAAVQAYLAGQTAWQEETGDDTSFLTYAYWDDTNCGLLSGEMLMSALDSMQAAYISKNPHRPEMTRTISLAGVCPNEFASLQSGNTCSFTLPLSLFDNADSPKYYMHKIRSVTVSIEVLLGVFQNIRARLVQTGSVILNDPNSKEALDYVSKYDTAATVPDKVTINRRAGQSISISEAVNESGMRPFGSSDGAYLPFEGTGAVSKWQLEFEDDNPFDLKDIEDVILNITYTAFESGKV